MGRPAPAAIHVGLHHHAAARSGSAPAPRRRGRAGGGRSLPRCRWWRPADRTDRSTAASSGSRCRHAGTARTRHAAPARPARRNARGSRPKAVSRSARRGGRPAPVRPRISVAMPNMPSERRCAWNRSGLVVASHHTASPSAPIRRKPRAKVERLPRSRPVPCVPVPIAPASDCGFTSPWLASASPSSHKAAVSRLMLHPAGMRAVLRSGATVIVPAMSSRQTITPSDWQSGMNECPAPTARTLVARRAPRPPSSASVFGRSTGALGRDAARPVRPAHRALSFGPVILGAVALQRRDVARHEIDPFLVLQAAAKLGHHHAGIGAGDAERQDRIIGLARHHIERPVARAAPRRDRRLAHAEQARVAGRRIEPQAGGARRARRDCGNGCN